MVIRFLCNKSRDKFLIFFQQTLGSKAEIWLKLSEKEKSWKDMWNIDYLDKHSISYSLNFCWNF